MKVLVRTVAGSHLFGTNTPTSDKDYKGVYLPTRNQILLGDYPDTFQHSTGKQDSKNTKDDIDTELYSVRKFFNMVERGDTAALELLFTPEEFILEKHPIWDEIVSHRDNLLSCKVSAMIGYARQQANKYGIKGSRMGELANCIKALKEIEKGFNFQNPKLKHNWDQVIEKLSGYEHIHFIELITDGIGTKVPAVDILGKKFDHHSGFPYVIKILSDIYKNFGQRAREAQKNNGIDWKALSHATRVSFQGIELLSKKQITLPLPPEVRTVIMDIKLGKESYSVTAERLEQLLIELEGLRESSSLPKELDKNFLNDILLKIYYREVIGE